MIRNATEIDHELLTDVCFSSKRYWGYPNEFFEIWADELTITPDYINKNKVFVYELDGEVSGFYSLVNLKNDLVLENLVLHSGTWLDHMFLYPRFIGKGIGSKMFSHCAEFCRGNCVSKIKILSDPNSKGFYEKLDCKYIEEYPSSIEGRTTPYLEYNLS